MDARTSFCAVDGVQMDAIAISPNDILALTAATNAPNVEINLATGVSSSRRRGESMSTEIVIELRGQDDAGHPLSTRDAVVHPQGQFPLTGLGVAMVLERCLGLDGQPPLFPVSTASSRELLDPPRRNWWKNSDPRSVVNACRAV